MRGEIKMLRRKREKKVRKKKGQFKIQQMSFMLLAVVLFFVLVALFWLAFHYSGLRKQASFLEEEKAIMISQFLSDSPEFNCRDNYCVDTDKLMVIRNRSVYREFWPVAFIKVRKIDNTTQDIICNNANYPDCNVFEVYKNEEIESKSSIGSFVALCRHEKVEGYPIKRCELGKMVIGYEVK